MNEPRIEKIATKECKKHKITLSPLSISATQNLSISIQFLILSIPAIMIVISLPIPNWRAYAPPTA